MAPTICSGKKRQTRTIATTNIRRHGSHQLNQTLSNIVNYVAKGPVNPRLTASLRIQNHIPTEKSRNGNYRNSNNGGSLNFNHLTQTSAISAANHRRQQFSFMSDNAVTSSTHSDTENSFDLRLANETLTNDSIASYGSNTNPYSSSLTSTSLSSSSISSATIPLFVSSSLQRETTSSSTSLREERRFQRQSNSLASNEDSSDYDVTTGLYEDDSNKSSASNTDSSHQIHSSDIRPQQHYFDCNDFDSVEKAENARELNNDMTSSSSMYEDDSNTDMDADETESMTSLDTEKSAKLKRGNHPLLRDKFQVKQQINDDKTKSVTNIRNTDGLLSIAIKTIKLVKRNQLLQQRLTQLQLETSEFIQSVLANPENRHFRENIKQKVQEVDNV